MTLKAYWVRVSNQPIGGNSLFSPVPGPFFSHYLFFFLSFLLSFLLFFLQRFNRSFTRELDDGKKRMAKIFFPSIEKIKKLRKTKRSWLPPLVFWGLSMVANVLNWLFHLLAGRTLASEELAILSVLLSFQYLLTVPANALGTTISRFTAYYTEKGEEQKHFYFFRQYWWLSWAIAGLFSLTYLFLANFIKGFFGFPSVLPVLIFALFIIPLFLFSFEMGLFFGRLAFIWIGTLYIIEAVVRFLLLFFSSHFPFPPLTMAVVSLPISVSLAWFISLLVGRSFHPLPVPTKNSERQPLPETYQFLGHSFVTGLGLVLIYNADILLVNHFFSLTEAGIYATLSLLGKVLYFGAGSLIGLLVPLTARAQAKKESGRKALLVVLGIVFGLGGAIWLGYLLLPQLTVQFLLGGKSLAATHYLTKYSLAMLFLALATGLVNFSLAKKEYLAANFITIVAVVEAILIFFFHHSLSQVVDIVFFSLFVLLLGLIVIEATGLTLSALLSNWHAFWRFLFPKVKTVPPLKSPRILIFNWRDIKHCQAGGAEVYLNELTKRLVKEGFAVTFFTANDGQCLESESVEGVNIIRRGGFLTVYFWAALYLLFRFRGKFDLVIDSENGIPFFSPIFSLKPVILLVYHVHRDVFLRSLLPPFSWLAVLMETFLMPLVYRQSPIATISVSTANDLKNELGLRATWIIPSGVDTKFYLPSQKSPTPLICYLGRLKEYKSIEFLLEAFAQLAKEIPQAQLVIAGEGDHRPALEARVKNLAINDKVRFLGRISEKQKVRLLGQSWVMVNPSYKEGWGITCLEANACGTPVLASAVEGLKEAVAEGESGFLFRYGEAEEIYRRLKDLILDKGKRESLSLSSRRWSEQFSWDEQTRKFILIINQVINNQASSSARWRPVKREEAQWIRSVSR